MALIQIDRVRLTALVLSCGMMLVGLSDASAGPLATTNFALNNGAGPDAGFWRGTALVAGAALGDTVTASVDWAAFPPGGLQDYLDGQGIAQVDPSGPNEVAYVYQITAVTAATPGIGALTVGLDPPDTRGIVLAPTSVPTGGANESTPTGGGDNNTSMAWFFTGAQRLQVGDTTGLLVFTSPNVPEFDYLQVSSGLAGPVVSPLVGSPSNLLFVPEPSALFLALVCGLGLIGTRRSALR
jgi:hypothetical protein